MGSGLDYQILTVIVSGNDIEIFLCSILRLSAYLNSCPLSSRMSTPCHNSLLFLDFRPESAYWYIGLSSNMPGVLMQKCYSVKLPRLSNIPRDDEIRQPQVFSITCPMDREATIVQRSTRTRRLGIALD